MLFFVFHIFVCVDIYFLTCLSSIVVTGNGTKYKVYSLNIYVFILRMFGLQALGLGLPAIKA